MNQVFISTMAFSSSQKINIPPKKVLPRRKDMLDLWTVRAPELLQMPAMQWPCISGKKVILFHKSQKEAQNGLHNTKQWRSLGETVLVYVSFRLSQLPSQVQLFLFFLLLFFFLFPPSHLLTREQIPQHHSHENTCRMKIGLERVTKCWAGGVE